MRAISSWLGAGTITAGLLGLACTMNDPAGAAAQGAALKNSAEKQAPAAAGPAAAAVDPAKESGADKREGDVPAPAEAAPAEVAPAEATPSPAAPTRPSAPATPPAAPPAEELDEGDDEKHGPMEQWMEDVVQPAVENEDVKALAKLLKKIEGMAPEASWNEGPKSWAKIAADGAKAAEAGDFKGAKASCKTCHQAWKKEYHKKHNARKIDTGK